MKLYWMTEPGARFFAEEPSAEAGSAGGAPAAEQPPLSAGGDAAGASAADGGEPSPAGEPGQGGDVASELDAVKAALAGAAQPQAAGADKQAQGAAQRKPKQAADPDFVAPQGISPDAQARFAKLVERTRSAEGAALKYQEMKPKFDEALAREKEFRDLFAEHHMAAEDLGAMLQYRKLVGDGDLKGARAMLFAELKKLSLEIGDEERAPDPLDDYEDLLSDVENGGLTRSRAIEIARSRAAQQSQQAAAQAARGASSSAQAETEQSERAIQDISAWAAEQRKSDIDYVLKEKEVLGMIDGIVAEYPPTLWLPTLKRLYSTMKAGGGAGAAAAPGGPRPLRPSGGAQVSRAPTSEQEAVTLAVRGALQ